MNMDPRLLSFITHNVAMVATKLALQGRPVSDIQWIPPAKFGDDPMGYFKIDVCRPLGALEVPPWEAVGGIDPNFTTGGKRG